MRRGVHHLVLRLHLGLTDNAMDTALSLLPADPPVVERRERRGPWLARYGDCERPIWRAEYATRPGGPLGEKCGGRVGHPRQPGVPLAWRPVGSDGEDQMPLFEICVVRVKA